MTEAQEIAEPVEGVTEIVADVRVLPGVKIIFDHDEALKILKEHLIADVFDRTGEVIEPADLQVEIEP